MPSQKREGRWFRRRPVAALVLTVTLFPLGVLLVSELLLALFLWFPQLNKNFPYCKPTAVYFFNDRNIIQFMPPCARYDSLLTYTLRPGQFDFGNREFSNRYLVNSLGVRDDEQSLKAPQVIVIGDSYAMGWGVEQDETFAQLIEKETGMNTLNTAVSSYGTAREMLMLGRVDTTLMKYLVVQYSNNDNLENQEFVQNDFHLKVMTREGYDSLCTEHMNRKRYFPLAFTSSFLRVVENFIKRKVSGGEPRENTAAAALTPQKNETPSPRPDLEITPQDEARMFLKIISRRSFTGVRLIVLNLTHYTLDSRSFIQALSELKNDTLYPPAVREMKVLDAASFLQPDDYYLIDDHLNASGHRKVAAAIIRAMD